MVEHCDSVPVTSLYGKSVTDGVMPEGTEASKAVQAMRPQHRTVPVWQWAVPLLLAGGAVALEPWLTGLVAGREAALPLVVFVVLLALLHPRIRTLMTVTLCYGVACMAVRDVVMARNVPLPPNLDYLIVDALRPVGLLLVAVLAAAAAIGETVRPGTVWARRCYFGAAALYFTGTGVINYAWHGSWKGLLLCITGVMALLGSVLAHRIVASEQEEVLEAGDKSSDEEEQRQRDLAHLQTLRAKEWHDMTG